jgi:hypothetical protein
MRGAKLLGAVLVLASCGGNVTVDPPRGTGGGTSSTTSSGTTSSGTSTSSSGGLPDCSTFGLVGPGVQCSLNGTACTMPYSCCHGGLVCMQGFWVVTEPDCADACLPCGSALNCATDAVCVHSTLSNDVYHCEKNPCTTPLTCGCAASLCTANYQKCQTTKGSTVLCGG